MSEASVGEKLPVDDAGPIPAAAEDGVNTALPVALSEQPGQDSAAVDGVNVVAAAAAVAVAGEDDDVHKKVPRLSQLLHSERQHRPSTAFDDKRLSVARPSMRERGSTIGGDLLQPSNKLQPGSRAPSTDNLQNMSSFQFFIASIHHTLFNEDGTPAVSRYGRKVVGDVGPRGSVVTSTSAAPRRTLDSGLQYQRQTLKTPSEAVDVEPKEGSRRPSSAVSRQTRTSMARKSTADSTTTAAGGVQKRVSIDPYYSLKDEEDEVELRSAGLVPVRPSGDRTGAAAASAGGGGTGAFADASLLAAPGGAIAASLGIEEPKLLDMLLDNSTGVKTTVEDTINIGGDNIKFAGVTAKVSVPKSRGQHPDWYIELTDKQLATLKVMLNVLDTRHTAATVDVEQLHKLLKELDVELRFMEDEVEDALQRTLDETALDRIDFDEFLYQLAKLDEGTGGVKQPAGGGSTQQYSHRQKVLFSAITAMSTDEPTTRTSITPIAGKPIAEGRKTKRPAYIMQAAESYQDRLEHTYKAMVNAARCEPSPLAYPLPFTLNHIHRRKPVGCRVDKKSGKRVRPRHLTIHDISPIALAALRKASLLPRADEGARLSLEVKNLKLDEDDIKYVVGVYAHNGSVVARLPGADRIQKLRDKLDLHIEVQVEVLQTIKDRLKIPAATMSIYEPLTSSRRKKNEASDKLNRKLHSVRQMQCSDLKFKRGIKTKHVYFFVPGSTPKRVPIPRFRLTSCERQHNTPYIIQEIEKRKDEMYGRYRAQLKRAFVQHTWDLLCQLPLKELDANWQERFLHMYQTYEPVSTKDIFVIRPHQPPRNETVAPLL